MINRAISLPFRFDETGSIGSTESEPKMWQDRVVTAVMTSLGERVMRPTYGTEVKRATFENINDAMAIIEQSVSAAFSSWLPSLSFTGLVGYIDKSTDELIIDVKYKYNQDLETNVTIKTAILSRSGEIIMEG